MKQAALEEQAMSEVIAQVSFDALHLHKYGSERLLHGCIELRRRRDEDELQAGLIGRSSGCISAGGKLVLWDCCKVRLRKVGQRTLGIRAQSKPRQGMWDLQVNRIS